MFGIPSVVLSLLRITWPFILAGAIWGVQEVRIGMLNSSLAASHKRETVAQSLLEAARQRATDLALLYAGMIPQVDAAAKAQEERDGIRIQSLNDRIRALSRVADVHLSAAAVGVLRDATAVANGGDAAPAGQPPEGAAPVPPVSVSEADVAEFGTVAAEAYLSCVRMFHATRDLYNAARNAQIGVSQ